MIVYCQAGLVSPKVADTFPWNIHEKCGIFAYEHYHDSGTKSALYGTGVQSKQQNEVRPK